MFQSNSFKCKKLPRIILILKRNRSNKPHWTKYEKRDFPRFKALDYFDDFYKNVYGENLWRSLRLGLLCNNKYCAIVNNFSEPDQVMTNLENRGALNMRDLFAQEAERLKESSHKKTTTLDPENLIDRKMEELYSRTEENEYLSKTYSQYEYVNILDLHNKDARNDPEEEEKEENRNAKEESEEAEQTYVEKYSLEEGLKDADLDHKRIIYTKGGLSSSTLYEFVPASKIKGIDTIMKESQHFDYYKQSLDFPINIEEEITLNFPKHLNIYTYEKCNVTSFPHPSIGSTGVLDFYLMDGASILPVLALDLQPNDCMLDMCGAPGGKSLTAFQTLLLDQLVCNDIFRSRVDRIKKVLSEYLYNRPEKDKFHITKSDALNIKERDKYNKILVDVPCTNDKISVNRDEGNWFMPNRMSERLKLPELQSDLLANALRLVAPGGTVVYSTCSLSPVQNDGVIQMSLRKLWEEDEHEFVIKDMTQALQPANIIYYLGNTVGMKYGTVVLPHLTANFGPLYFSKIVKVE